MLGEALREADIPFVAHKDRFAHDTPDEQWLAFAGRCGYPILTRDRQIRYKPNEVRAFERAGVVGFFFTAGDLNSQRTAQLAVRAYPQICDAVASGPAPAMYSIDAAGKVRALAIPERRLRR